MSWQSGTVVADRHRNRGLGKMRQVDSRQLGRASVGEEGRWVSKASDFKKAEVVLDPVHITSRRN